MVCKQTLVNSRLLCLAKNGHELCTSIKIAGIDIKCEDHIKLPGVYTDYLLNFDMHISNLYKKAAKQKNVLLRLK